MPGPHHPGGRGPHLLVGGTKVTGPAQGLGLFFPLQDGGLGGELREAGHLESTNPATEQT